MVKSTFSRKVPRILLVDDDLFLHSLISTVFSIVGYEVITAASGEEGVRRVRTDKPDLVLMDVMMPGIDGFEAARRIRRLPEGRQLPIIFLSALDSVDAKITGLRIGGDDYVTKPVQTGELMARVEVHLRAAPPITGQMIAVFGSVDDVGTTTLVINLGLSLRKISQGSVLLVDWKRPLGDIASFLGLSAECALESLLSRLDDLNGETFSAELMEYVPGVRVLCGATSLTSADRMHRESLTQVLEWARIEADYVLVDCGSYFSWDIPPLIPYGQGTNLCLLTPEATAVERAADALESVDVMATDFRLILNRHGVVRGMTRELIESKVLATLGGSVPEDSARLALAQHKGRPLYIVYPDSDFSRAVDDFATRIHDSSWV